MSLESWHTSDNAKGNQTAIEQSKAIERIHDSVYGAHAGTDLPQTFSDRQLDQMAGTAYSSLERDYNSGDIKLGPTHPTHSLFQQALKAGQLDNLVNKIEEKIWGPDGFHHLDISVSDGPKSPGAVSRRVTLTHTHTGEEVSHDDISVKVRR